MEIDKIIILDKKELSEIEIDFISNAINSISYIESNHAYFFYLEDMDKEIEEETPKEVKDMIQKFYELATDNKITCDIKILVTL